jgi:hypothetical protein
LLLLLILGSSLLHNIITDSSGNFETAAMRDGDYKVLLKILWKRLLSFFCNNKFSIHFTIGSPGSLTDWYPIDETTAAVAGQITNLYLFDIASI